MKRILTPEFFDKPVLKAAPELLGKYLVRRLPRGGIAARMITEVEAYDGEEDLACHASKGRTKRTETLYGPSGRWYVYLCYGMYHMLNIVTGPENYPAAILIRELARAEDAKGPRNSAELKGPGVLTRELGIGKEFNGKTTSSRSGLWIEDRGVIVSPEDIVRAPRIGVHYAKEWALKPYRFYAHPGSGSFRDKINP